jgi:hypothetical protein
VIAAAAGVTLAACGSSSSGGGGSNGGGGSSSIDPCVVGTWVATQVMSRFNATGAVVQLSGGAGLVLSFSGDGAETADWSGMAPLTTTIPVDVTQTYRGQSHYRVSTGGGTLSFLSADYSGWSAEQSFAGQSSSLTGPNPVAPESYTCSQTTFTEQNSTWAATFTRR